MNNKVLLGIGVGLCLFGFFKPNLDSILPARNPSVATTNIEKPNDENLLSAAQKVIDVLRNNNALRQDCLRLSSLYADMSLLISLDGEQQLVRNTEEIRQSNRISGLMLKMNLNDKYPNLASAMNNVITAAIGDDNLPLTTELRNKSAEAFSALAWACSEGAK